MGNKETLSLEDSGAEVERRPMVQKFPGFESRDEPREYWLSLQEAVIELDKYKLKVCFAIYVK